MNREIAVKEIAERCGPLCSDFAQFSCSSQNCGSCSWLTGVAKDIYDYIVLEIIKETEKKTAGDILYYLKSVITDGLLRNHEILNSLIEKYKLEEEE